MPADIIVDNKLVTVKMASGQVAVLEYRMGNNGEIIRPTTVRYSENTVEAEFLNCRIKDKIFETENGVSVLREWELTRAGSWVLYFDTEVLLENANLMIPGLLYNENRFGKGLFPEGGLGSCHSFREDRTPVPACSVVYSELGSFSLYTETASSENEISSIQSRNLNGHPGLSIRIPWEEGPVIFDGKSSGRNSEQGQCSKVLTESDLPFIYKRNFYIYSDKNKNDSLPLESYRNLVSGLYPDGILIKNSGSSDWTEFVHLKLTNLLFLAQNDNQEFLPFIKMGKGNGACQKTYEYTSGSFLVRSLEGAWIIAMTAALTERNDLFRLAEKIGEFFLKGRRNLGLHYDNYDLDSGEWGGYLGISENCDLRFMFNARANGETMSGYVRLYKTLMKSGINRHDFLETAVENAEFYLSRQLDSGSFGRWWDENGNSVDSSGVNGAHIVCFLLDLEPYYSGEYNIREAVCKAADYYGHVVDKGEYYGDTLDADSYDRESGQILLHMFIDMYLYSDVSRYLDFAVKAADFLLTWIWQYDVVFPEGTPLAEESFRTTGMTSVSVAHHHLDFYGLQIGYDFLRLWKITGTQIYKTMGLGMINACRQLVAVPGRLLGRGPEYAGWQPEQMNHTNWDYFNRPLHQKGFFDICISWVTVLELSALFKLKEEFPDFIEFDVFV